MSHPKKDRDMPSRSNLSDVRDVLSLFDTLPESAQVRQPVVEALFGICGTTVWRRVNSGLLPKPRKFGPRTTTWNVGELRAVLNGFQVAA